MNEEKIKQVRKIIGGLFGELRKDKELSQREVAEKANCTRPNISQLESLGINSIDTIIGLSEVLEVDLADFFFLLSESLRSENKERSVSLRMLESNLKKRAEAIKDFCDRQGIKCEVSIHLIHQ